MDRLFNLIAATAVISGLDALQDKRLSFDSAHHLVSIEPTPKDKLNFIWFLRNEGRISLDTFTKLLEAIKE